MKKRQYWGGHREGLFKPSNNRVHTRLIKQIHIPSGKENKYNTIPTSSPLLNSASPHNTRRYLNARSKSYYIKQSRTPWSKLKIKPIVLVISMRCRFTDRRRKSLRNPLNTSINSITNARPTSMAASRSCLLPVLSPEWHLTWKAIKSYRRDIRCCKSCRKACHLIRI